MPIKARITPCLWFDDQAEAAVNFYLSIFKNSRITQVTRYSEAGKEFHGRKPGTVLTVGFELDGQPFTALNGGPQYHFTEALSLQIDCKDQAEVDYFWEKLSQGEGAKAMECGWLKDKYGLSWQVVPDGLMDMLADPDPAKSGRAMMAMMGMVKFDIAAIRMAYEGAAKNG